MSNPVRQLVLMGGSFALILFAALGVTVFADKTPQKRAGTTSSSAQTSTPGASSSVSNQQGQSTPLAQKENGTTTAATAAVTPQADFPQDIPGYAGATLTFSKGNPTDGWYAVYLTADSVDKVVSAYSQALQQNGWGNLNTSDVKADKKLTADKEGRQVTAIVGKLTPEQNTNLIVGVTNKK